MLKGGIQVTDGMMETVYELLIGLCSIVPVSCANAGNTNRNMGGTNKRIRKRFDIARAIFNFFT